MFDKIPSGQLTPWTGKVSFGHCCGHKMGALTEDDDLRVGVLLQQPKRLCLHHILAEARLTRRRDAFLVFGIQRQGQDVPGMKSLSVRRRQLKRGDLVACIHRVDQHPISTADVMELLDLRANPHFSGLLTSCQNKVFALCRYNKL